MNKRISVILLNLGGPDGQKSVLPFLRNLFRDPAILRIPTLPRLLLAEIIARLRLGTAKKIYGSIGGGSPIRKNCQAQADSIQKSLTDVGQVGVFLAMRYWHPRAIDAVEQSNKFKPDKTILLPLYPQFSTTSTESSLDEWRKIVGGDPNIAIGCYPELRGFVDAYSEQTRICWERAEKIGQPRLLFSAHGLPKKIANSGDPYVVHVQQSAKAIAKTLQLNAEQWRVCYQSRVGPLEWVGPSTDQEIIQAGIDGVPIVLVPIAFTSEHSETLVELDVEYAKLAAECAVPGYFRVPTVSTNPIFIESLSKLIMDALNGNLAACPRDKRLCCPVQACPSGDSTK